MGEIIPLEGAPNNIHITNFLQALEGRHLARNTVIANGRDCIAFSVNTGIMSFNTGQVDAVSEALADAGFDRTQASLLYIPPGKLPNPPFSTYTYGIAIFPESNLSPQGTQRTFENSLIPTIFDGNKRISKLARITQTGLEQMGTQNIRASLEFGFGTLKVRILKK